MGSWYNSTDMIHFWLGEKIVLFVSHPESVETVLNSTSMIDKPERYGVLGEFLGRGLITLNGEKASCNYVNCIDLELDELFNQQN